MNRRPTVWVVGGLLVFSVSGAWAQGSPAGKGEETVKKEDVKTWTTTVDGKEYEVHPATPTYNGDTGLFHLSSAYTLPKGKFSFSLFRDNLDRDPKDVDISIIGLSLAYGATSRFELFGNIGLQNRVDVDAGFQPGFISDYPLAGKSATSPGWQTGVGDVKLGAKYKFLDDYHGDGLGLALRGYVKLPTADDAAGLGTGKVSVGGDLVLSKSLSRGADVHGSVGYQYNANPNGLNVGNALKWGVGFNVPAFSKVQLQAEVTGLAYKSADFEQTKPVDLVVGPVFWFKPGIFIRPAFSWNLNFDDRGLNQGTVSKSDFQVSVGYHPGFTSRVAYTPPPPPPPQANRAPTVACEVEKSSILAGETVRCRARASDPDGDPLTYQWTASSGRVTGSGAEGTFDSAGVSAPATVTVTVRVSDGRGGTAESQCSIRVEKPQEKKPEPIPCTSGGFPRNLARLNNVDKACLDDVAARLKQDPRSRVVIVGHADGRELHPEVIGRKRAEAVKTYLVKERGVDESRIGVRSAGASKPLDTGNTNAARAKNRRVEMIFVPEGASVPEDDD